MGTDGEGSHILPYEERFKASLVDASDDRGGSSGTSANEMSRGNGKKRLKFKPFEVN